MNTAGFDGGHLISPDGLTLYFNSEPVGGSGRADLWIAKRARPTKAFGAPENLGASINSAANEFAPSISADELSIYFDSDRPGGLGSRHYRTALVAKTN